jgi:hypothetical protein
LFTFFLRREEATKKSVKSLNSNKFPKMAKKVAAAAVFNEGDRVFAKVKGYPAWPARVVKPLDAKMSR